jgi:hypothetical protein
MVGGFQRGWIATAFGIDCANTGCRRVNAGWLDPRLARGLGRGPCAQQHPSKPAAASGRRHHPGRFFDVE